MNDPAPSLEPRRDGPVGRSVGDITDIQCDLFFLGSLPSPLNSELPDSDICVSRATKEAARLWLSEALDQRHNKGERLIRHAFSERSGTGFSGLREGWIDCRVGEQR